MSLIKSIRHLHRDPDCIENRERTALKHTRQQQALDELHDYEIRALVFTDIIDRRYIRRTQCRSSPRFFEESFSTIRVILIRSGKEFQSNVSTEPGIFGTKDLAHSAPAEPFAYIVVKYRFSYHF